MKRKYANKYHLRPWVVKSVLVTDCIIDGITETVKFIGGIIFPALLLGTALGGIEIILLKITGVIA
jgi:hypothetical protein